MYLKNIKIWNFRKFGGVIGGEPGLDLDFHERFNLLIGENDSGKSAIIDAIHLTLGTLSAEKSRILEEDFHVDVDGDVSDSMIIECKLSGLSDKETGIFLEWLSFDENNEYELIVRLSANKIYNELFGQKIQKFVKAGPIEFQQNLEGFSQELLKTTYLKPLRDAESELKPGYKSRLAQILKSYSAFKVPHNGTHQLEDIANRANDEIKSYFDMPIDDKTITGEISNYLNEFFNVPKADNEVYNPKFEVTPARLNDILKKLSLELDDKVSGLGSSNLLFIAAELLLLNDGELIGPNLTLIEEIEAHLHPQAQLRLIKYLQNIMDKSPTDYNGQFILSTHSTTLAASTSLEHIILLHNNNCYPMGEENTSLAKEDYEFLERFLDATKSNLFFARGVILVEGDAENLLLPALAEVIDRPLHKYGVSIVNIRNTAFKRYSKIFSRSKQWLDLGKPSLELPVAVITDVDVRPLEYYIDKEISTNYYIIENKEELTQINKLCEGVEEKDLEELIGHRFSTFKKFQSALEKLDARIIEGKEDLVVQTMERSINKREISDKRKEKIQLINSEYQDTDANLNVFIAPNWTLEYELALSTIGEHLAKVIHNLRYKHPSREKVLSGLKANLESLKEQETKEYAAYDIYKPLNDKVVSKAIVAQKLAEEILEEKDNIKESLVHDPYLNYLIEAIFHVTEPLGGE